MTNWHDPDREIAENIAHIKFIHVMGGLYIWEFVLNLDYEYSILVGRRNPTWTSLLYFGCRWSTLLVVILEFLNYDLSHFNCQALITATFIFAGISVMSSSALVLLRIYALWEQSKTVIIVSSAFWLGNAISYIYSVTTFRSHLIGGFCEVYPVLHARIFIFSTFTMDLVLLAFMFTGILRWKGAHGGSRTWWFLYKQSLAWVVVFTLAELPPVVFISLNLNDVMNSMFLAPSLILMAIGASRMYLGLINDIAFQSPPNGITERSLRSARMQAQSPGPSYPPEGTYNIGGAALISNSSTSTVPQNLFGEPKVGKSLEGITV